MRLEAAADRVAGHARWPDVGGGHCQSLVARYMTPTIVTWFRRFVRTSVSPALTRPSATTINKTAAFPHPVY